MSAGGGRFGVSARLARCITAAAAACIIIAFWAGLATSGAAAQGNPVEVHGRVTTEPARNWVDYAQLAAVAATLLTAGVIWRQLVAASAAARRERAAALAAVWADREFRKMLSPTLGLLEVEDVDDCMRKLRLWTSAPRAEERCLPAYPETPDAVAPAFLRKNDVLHVLNAVEEVAIQYNENQADREWIALMLGPHLIRMLHSGLWLVSFLRRDDVTTFSEWMHAVDQLRKPRSTWPRLTHPYKDSRDIWEGRWQKRRPANVAELRLDPGTQPVRIVCIPPTPARAKACDWSRAKALSHLLADGPRQLHLLERPALKPRTKSSQSGWSVVVVPESIDAAVIGVRPLFRRPQRRLGLAIRSLRHRTTRRIPRWSTTYWSLTMLLALTSGFLLVDRFVFGGSTSIAVADALGSVLLVAGLLAAHVRRRRGGASPAIVVAMVGGWTILAMLLLEPATARWVAFADGVVALVLAILALALHELTSEDLVAGAPPVEEEVEDLATRLSLRLWSLTPAQVDGVITSLQDKNPTATH